MKLADLIGRAGFLSGAAGRCMVRYSPGRIFATYHPDAPRGVTTCTVCGRWVVRGLTSWWDR